MKQMPDSELGKKILTENQALRDLVGDLTAKIDNLEDEGKHTRWLAYALTAAIAVVLVVWGFGRVNNRVDELQNYQVAACNSANETRALDRAFWTDDILGAIAPPGSGAGAQEFRAKIQPKVDKRYAQRDCSKVREGQQPAVPTDGPSAVPRG